MNISFAAFELFFLHLMRSFADEVEIVRGINKNVSLITPIATLIILRCNFHQRLRRESSHLLTLLILWNLNLIICVSWGCRYINI